MNNVKVTEPQLKWRNAQQLRGYLGQLRTAILQSKDGAYVTIDMKTAEALVEILRQAIHTEVGHEK